jgi:hypothetical protein
MFIVFDHPSLASSGGATSECLDVAPPELARCVRMSSINIQRRWRSRPITLIPMTFDLHTPHLNGSLRNCKNLGEGCYMR